MAVSISLVVGTNECAEVTNTATSSTL